MSWHGRSSQWGSRAGISSEHGGGSSAVGLGYVTHNLEVFRAGRELKFLPGRELDARTVGVRRRSSLPQAVW